jgi:hypothetical protein
VALYPESDKAFVGQDYLDRAPGLPLDCSGWLAQRRGDDPLIGLQQRPIEISGSASGPTDSDHHERNKSPAKEDNDNDNRHTSPRFDQSYGLIVSPNVEKKTYVETVR